jgi:hypothetical protein
MIHPALDKPYIQLICNPYEHSTSVNTRITIDVSRTEMLEVMQSFMKAMGYGFTQNEVLCIEEYE